MKTTYEVRVLRREGKSPISIVVVESREFHNLENARCHYKSWTRRAANGSRLRVRLNRHRESKEIFMEDLLDSYASPRTLR